MAETIAPINKVMRTPLRELLDFGRVDLASLSSFCRILLTTDGTLTETLEAFFLERIQLVKVAEGLRPAPGSIPVLNVWPGEDIIERKILLQGARTNVNYVYAETTVVVNAMPDEMRHGLLRTQTPIGRLWLENKLETFKEMVEMRRTRAGDLAQYFGITPDQPILSRTYRVYSGRKPVILIVEKFSENISTTR